MESFAMDPTTRTTDPIVTGASVLGLKYKDGVMMISDTLGSYGSMARYTSLERIRKVNNTTIVGAGGEYSDFQTIVKVLEELSIADFCEDDQTPLTPREIYSYLSRLMYGRRTKVNPLYNQVIIAGVTPPEKKEEKETKEGKKGDKKEEKDKESPSNFFLGTVDLYGSTYEDNILATGYGKYMAIPLLRKAWKADLTEAEAKTLLEDCMRVLYYRDCRTINKFLISKVTKDGPSISQPYSLTTQWEYSRFVQPDSS